jgi:hypothetical protein
MEADQLCHENLHWKGGMFPACSRAKLLPGTGRGTMRSMVEGAPRSRRREGLVPPANPARTTGAPASSDERS